MSVQPISPYQHESPVYALAVSRGGTLLAVGGAADTPVTVLGWPDRDLKIRLTGLVHQTHALAFSKDGLKLAAANLWGGLCVWSLQDGSLLGSKPETRGRRARALAYPDRGHGGGLYPLMLSESIHQAASRVLANNGRYLAVVDGALMIRQYPGPKAIARFDPFGSELTRSGIRRISWALDSRRLVMAGDGWLGAWQPFDPDQPAAAEALEMPEPVSAIALLDEPTRIAYAIDRVVTFRSLPQAPLAPPSSSWQRWLKSLPRPTVGQPGSTSWQWNVSPSGYDGVDVHNSHLTFFNVTYPAYAGGWGQEQSLEDFLRDGPASPIPSEFLAEVCLAVLAIVNARTRGSSIGRVG